jgi:O-antigen/teichoic acid export membrane protein
MGTELKKTVGHAGVYTIGVLLSRLVSFVMLPVYTNFLSPSDYGVLELLEMTVIAVSIFAGLGIHNGLFKYYYECDNERDRMDLVSTAFLLVIGFYGMFCAIGVFSSSYLSSLVIGGSSYVSLFKLSFVNLFLQFLIFVPLAYVRAQQKSVLFVVVNTVQMVLQVSLNIIFVVYQKMGVPGILLSTLITYVVVGLWMSIYAFTRVGFRFSAERASHLIRFGAPFVLSGVGAFIMTFSDRLFIKHYWTISDVGIYSLAYKFGFLLMMFPVFPICNI